MAEEEAQEVEEEAEIAPARTLSLSIFSVER